MENEHGKIKIEASPEIETLLEERGIRKEDVERVIARAEETGNVFVHKDNKRYLGCWRPVNTTYWVEYTHEEDVFRVSRAYSHRMLTLEGFNMPAKRKETADWLCFKCNVQLELATVKLTYLEETFGADTFACPLCGRVFVSEEDAVKKMALAEKMLEDK